MADIFCLCVPYGHLERNSMIHFMPIMLLSQDPMLDVSKVCFDGSPPPVPLSAGGQMG